LGGAKIWNGIDNRRRRKSPVAVLVQAQRIVAALVRVTVEAL
jgi:hypothetical protein